MVPVDVMHYVAKGLSPTAAWLYVVLLSHHNRKREDNDVWPSRKSLAEALGLKKVDNVDRYLRELSDSGLIKSRRRAGGVKGDGVANQTSVYTLLLTVKPERPKAQETAPPPPSAGAPHPHQWGYPHPHESGNPTPAEGTRTRGSELDESELDEMNNSWPPLASLGTPQGVHDDETEVVEAEIGNWADPWAS
jgi:DNA-binding transcriptional MocR family regulator